MHAMREKQHFRLYRFFSGQNNSETFAQPSWVYRAGPLKHTKLLMKDTVKFPNSKLQFTANTQPDSLRCVNPVEDLLAARRSPS
jgi:hypothetical protein